MKDRKRYYDDALDWATDVRQRESRSLRSTRLVAGVAVGIAALEAIALVALTPLKTVKAVTVLVDRQTGFVQTLDPDTPRRVQADAALTASMLAQYVVAREGFDRATIANDYQRVALWSTDRARSQYLALMPSTNPESPVQRYPWGTVVLAHVKSVSPLSNGTALVRFDTQQQDRAGRTSTAEPWIAVVQYRYSDAAMPFEKRLVNPLGFQVTRYRRDPEAVAPTSAGGTQGSATAPLSRRDVTFSPTPQALDYPYNLARRGVFPNQVPNGSPLGPFDRYASPSTGMSQR